MTALSLEHSRLSGDIPFRHLWIGTRMKKHTEETKAQVLDLRGQGLSYMGIVRALADQDVEVSASTVTRWTKKTQGPESGPEEAEWSPTFNEQIQAVREILDGNNAPDWMDQKIFVDLSKSLAIAENQHRLSNVRQTETGLTRPHAIAFIRRILLEVEKRYRVRGDTDKESIHEGLIAWTRAVVGEYNITLARDL